MEMPFRRAADCGPHSRPPICRLTVARYTKIAATVMTTTATDRVGVRGQAAVRLCGEVPAAQRTHSRFRPRSRTPGCAGGA